MELVLCDCYSMERLLRFAKSDFGKPAMSQYSSKVDQIEARHTELVRVLASLHLLLVITIFLGFAIDIYLLEFTNSQVFLFAGPNIVSDWAAPAEGFTRADLIGLPFYLSSLIGVIGIFFLRKWAAWLWLISWIASYVTLLVNPQDDLVGDSTLFFDVIEVLGLILDPLLLFSFVGNIRWHSPSSPLSVNFSSGLLSFLGRAVGFFIAVIVYALIRNIIL